MFQGNGWPKPSSSLRGSQKCDCAFASESRVLIRSSFFVLERRSFTVTIRIGIASFFESVVVHGCTGSVLVPACAHTLAAGLLWHIKACRLLAG